MRKLSNNNEEIRHEYRLLLNKAKKKGRLSREELSLLLKPQNIVEEDALFSAADSRRKEAVGDAVHLRALIEFSNFCRCNCLYCGLRRKNDKAARYRMTGDEIVDIAHEAVKLGYRTVVLQSGEDPWYTGARVSAIIRRIKAISDVTVTLSLGERTFEELRDWREAGADRYLLRHETANPLLYAKLNPQRKLSTRLKTLEHLRQLGYQVGAGFMVGLPDQKVEDLAEDLLLLQNLDVEMAGIGPFIPHPQTPLGDKKQGTLSLTLRALAAARLLIPCAHLPATTAIRSIDPQGWLKALKAGANVLMLNLTPPVHREKYKIYPDKYSTGGTPASVRQSITELIHSLGRTVAEDRGDSPKPQFQRSECPL